MEPVRENSPKKSNDRISAQILESLSYYYYHKDEIRERISELDQEWDIERALELNAALFAFTGTMLAATVDRRWLVLPAIVTAFLAQHAVQGWCPPLPVLRALGFRTREEIDAERYGLKVLAGDFDVPNRTKEVWEAINK